MNSVLFVHLVLPDIAYVKIEYFPTGGKCVELKSLKYYFVSFRNVGIYQEVQPSVFTLISYQPWIVNS